MAPQQRYASLGLLVALPAEAQPLHPRKLDFTDLTQTAEGHHLIVSGAGSDNAQQAASRLVEQGVAGLISWGCAGALAPDLKPGDLIVPERIHGADGTGYATDTDWRRRFLQALSPAMPIKRGQLAESRHVVPGPAEKQALFAATNAAAVDMESAAVARVAQSHGLPFLAVRAIADTSAMAMPAAVLVALNPRGDVRLGKLLAHLARHPAQVGELIRLGRAFGAAVGTLRRVRQAAGTDFCFPPR
ncbi:phosphorylase family protein [Methylomagnum sp.]